jgi:YHS domain-containing protein
MKKLTMMIFMLLMIPTIYSCSSSDEVVGDSASQNVCPVLRQGIECEINKEVYTDYKGRRIYACSEGCLKEFTKNPDKYIKLLEEQGVLLEKIPVK